MDRISNLPDPLISHILSFLPTKDAVATSVLSTKWKFLWTFITNLQFDFDCDLWKGRLAVQEFSLDLSWEWGHQFTFSQIDTNVAALKLSGWGIDFSIPAAASLRFPSLQALHLTNIPFKISSNSSISFPNLKIMRLTYVSFMDGDSAYKLLSSSPVLDDLYIEDASYDKSGCLNIRIPPLTRLSIELSDFYGLNKLLIDCCALQHLLFHGYLCEYLFVGNLSCLVQANAHISYYEVDVESYNNITKFVQSLANVKFLSVSDDVLKALKTTSTNITSGFHNLMHLGILFFYCTNLGAMISNFLEHVDNLEHITMKGHPVLRSNCSHPSWRTEPVNVPKCLLSRVTTISFSYMNVDCCDQLELLRYFLKNAKVLQFLTISIHHVSEREQLELVKKISLMPRGSQNCQISFT